MAATIAGAQPAKDVSGSRDHPMISRFEGASITWFDQKEFDEHRIATGPVPGYRPDGTSWGTAGSLNDANSVRLEGRVWKFRYSLPKSRSTLEVVRSYESALTKSGFEVIYRCALLECAGGPPAKGTPNTAHWYGGISWWLMNLTGLNIQSFGGMPDQRYIAARLRRPEGDVYVGMLALEFREPLVRLDVVEVKPLEGGAVSVDAAALAKSLASDGSVKLYGILFDTDRADVKPESRPALTEIASLMKQNGKLQLVVVGHTDNNGTLDHNIDLSLRRAQAVVAALVSNFGVERTRLEARGVGFLAPVAPNTSEENKAKNRRVELVQR
jgi:outer membrane protein OmpA-like peptidoglycan-associated protein